MATNPMQRKARNSFLLGMLITLVIAGAIIALLFIQLKNYKEKEQEEKQKRPWKKKIREDTERESGSSKTGKIGLSDCGSLQISSDQPSVLRRR